MVDDDVRKATAVTSWPELPPARDAPLTGLASWLARWGTWEGLQDRSLPLTRSTSRLSSIEYAPLGSRRGPDQGRLLEV